MTSINSISNKTAKNKMKLKIIMRYIEAGFALLPLEPKGKKPLTELLPDRSWKPFQKRPATKPEVGRWLNKYPDLNIGIITGEPSDLIVIDIDRPSLVEIEEDVAAPRVRTGRGLHLYCKADREAVKSRLQSSEGDVVADIKAEGGYVVAPPSVHPTGASYEWDKYFNLNNFSPPPYSALNTTSQASDTRIIINTCITEVTEGETEEDLREDALTNPVGLRGEDTPEWKKLTGKIEVAQDVMSMAGLENVQLGKAFSCPFHEEKQPSAAIWRPDDGYIAFHDFHRRGGQEWYNLADVYKAIKTDKELKKLQPAAGVVWWLRCLNELGYLEELPALQAKKLQEPFNGRSYLFEDEDGKDYAVMEDSVKKVYEGLKYLLQLRSIYDFKQRGTPFSWRFAVDWCGVSINTAQKSMRFLMQKGYVYVRDEREDHQANILDVKRKKQGG